MILVLSILISILVFISILVAREIYILNARSKLIKEMRQYEENLENTKMTPEELLFDLEHFDDRMKELDQKAKKLFPYIGG